MKAAEHLEQAEIYLNRAINAVGQGLFDATRAYSEIAKIHAMIAHAVEVGVPHVADVVERS